MIREKISYICYRLKKVFGSDAESAAVRYIEDHNRNVLKKKFRIPPEKIMILMPHCIQNSECGIRITFNPQNCIRCGKCAVSELVAIAERFNVMLCIATGGTIARKLIRDKRPEAIIATACFRDLTEGLSEIPDIPVVGVLNIIGPSGPCVNTDVDTEKIKELIYFFTGIGSTEK